MSALESDPGDAQAWNAKGEKLRGRKEPAECAERALKPTRSQDWAWKFIHGYSDHDWLWMWVVMYGHDGVRNAPPCFDRALELDPGCAWAWYNKGVALDDLRGATNPGAVLALIDTRLDDLRGAGGRDDELRLREETLAYYERALEIDPGYVLAWHSKGYALFHLERHDESLGCYDRALEIDPCYALAWYNKGAALYCLLRYEDALACFERCLELDPSNAVAWYNKSTALYALGRRKEARQARRTAERLRRESRRRR